MLADPYTFGVLIPTDKEIRALHRKYAPTQEAFDLVYTHCVIVCGIAEQLLTRTDLNLNADLVRAGSLLHDIGVYRLYGTSGKLDQASYIRHGILGYELLQHEGFPEAICRFCSCHTGMGLSRDDVRKQGLPLPIADYLAESGEEELVMYADKFHSKTEPPTFVTAASYAAHVRRFGEDKTATFRLMCESFGAPDLTPFITLHGYALA
ncbi:MAG: metal dependent phosphohydrolase [Streptosporangiaceae bacterium]|nr:metal dependent phosphohydrolase [Streptosporangiaceae bacterium]